MTQLLKKLTLALFTLLPISTFAQYAQFTVVKKIRLLKLFKWIIVKKARWCL